MIRINSRCIDLFALAGGSFAELGPDVHSILNSGFSEDDNTIVLGHPDPVTRVERSLFDDPVGYEAAANEIYVQPAEHDRPADLAGVLSLAK